MGIIAKQSIKGSIYTYIGAAIGFINTGLLMPKFFVPEQVGLVNLLIAVTLVFSQLGNLGFSGVITRLFPYFRDKNKKHNGILTIGLFVSLSGFLLTFLLFIVVRKYLIVSVGENSSLLSENIFYVPILSFFVILFFLFDNYNKVLFDAVLGTFLREFLVRFLDLLLIVVFIFNYIDFESFVMYYIIIYSLPTLILAIVLLKRKVFFTGGINFKLLTELKSEIIKIAVFWIVAGFAGIAIQAIDKYMTNYYLGLGASGIYAVTFYFGVLVAMPSRSMRKISSIVLSESWKKNDQKTILDIYKKSTVNMLIIGSLLVVGIWANIDNIFAVIPKYAEGKYVILFIALLSLVDMTSGVAASIIANSKYYKIGAYIMILTLFLIVITNIIFINLWGLKGAAFASLISMTTAVLIRFLFLYKKYQFQPYSLKHIKIVLIAVVVLFINYFIPKFSDFYIDILVRSSVITVLFSVLIWFSKVSEDINKIVLQIIKKLKNN